MDNNLIGFDEDGYETYECWNCGGEGYSHHDCGEDTCVCLDPYPNIVCNVCRGEGGYIVKEQEKE